MCRSLSLMDSLNHLHITLRQLYFFIAVKGTAQIPKLVVGLLQPLKSISVRGEKPDFLVRIGWHLDQEMRAGLGDCPFQIMEQEELLPHQKVELCPVSDGASFASG